jgi:uncharacterized delta-60 repeat protein
MKTDISFKRVAAFTLPCLCWTLVASTTACGDDDDDNNGEPTAGSGGSSAGKGSAGSSNGGKSAAGSANGGNDAGGTPTAGTAGKSNGGTGTDAGAPPVGGTGGEQPGGGGEGGGEQPGGGGEGGGGGEITNAVPYIINASPTGHDRLYNTTFDAAGNLYAVGQITTSNDATADIATLVAKFTPEGKLDTSFGSGGLYVRNVANGTNGELFRGIVVQSTGKIVVSGTIEQAGAVDARDRDGALMRINVDGTKDTTFGLDGILKLPLSTGVVRGTGFSVDSVWGLARYADDRLVVSGGKVREGGTDTNFVILRFSANGEPDLDFGTAGMVEVDTAVEGEPHNNASPRNVTILPGTDGIVGAGYQPKPGADTSPVVFKVTDGGELDDTFGDHGVFHAALLDEQTESYSAVVQPIVGGGYKLVTTGYGRQLETETTDLVSLRLTSNGQIDETYGENGLVRIDVGGFGDNSRNLLVLPDRRIVLVGGGRLTSANVDGVVAVLTPDGAPDTSVGPDGWKRFDLGGPADFFWGVSLSPNQHTLGIVGIKGAGNAPMPAGAADDAAVLWLPVP